MVIHDFSNRSLTSHIGTDWRAVSDQVMGGVSEPAISLVKDDDRYGLRLTGDVRLENNGGFIQASLDLATGGGTFDASAFSGIALVVRGNDERYSVHLRTADTIRPWQSYRAHFTAGEAWQTVELPFDAFTPHRLGRALDLSQLRRLGLVAIGRAFAADLTVADIRFTS